MLNMCFYLDHIAGFLCQETYTNTFLGASSSVFVVVGPLGPRPKGVRNHYFRLTLKKEPNPNLLVTCEKLDLYLFGE
jgi:hypothetical protein